MTGSRALRLWHTARHLKPVQVYGRLWFRLHVPRPDLSPAPGLRAIPGPWQHPAARRPSLSGPHSFLFLGQTGSLDEIGWDGPAREKLWRYNQHYFDDLTALGSADRVAWHTGLLADWVASNPPGTGTGWEPYPTSLRLVNWVKRALGGQPLPEPCRQSLAVQARWLMRRLERHLQGNHLFANAKALVFAGAFFEGPEAARWLQTGLGILRRQIPEQILPDGGHFELATMYHALAVEDVLDLVNVLTAGGIATGPVAGDMLRQCRAVVPGMLRWLRTMTHPDGRIAFFNDAAFGIAPDVAEIAAYAARLGFGAAVDPGALAWLADSGYARLSAGPAVLLADLARIGPDYLPGHAHADTLSFELSLFSQRVIVNSGTSLYGSSAERLRQRGTAAHSTVTLGGADSSEVWGGFRVARRARPSGQRVVVASDGALVAEAAHDGYRRLPGAPLHRRRWTLSPGALAVEDAVTSPAAAAARYHLAAGVIATLASEREGTIVLPTGAVIRWASEGGAVRLDQSTWHPEFGQSIPTTCLVVPLAGGRARLTLTWT